MAERIFLSNDAGSQGGIFWDEEVFTFSYAGTTSAHGASASNVALAGPMKSNGIITDFVIGVTNPALSASGFVSGSISANVKINGVSACTTMPSILRASDSANVTFKATNVPATGVTPAVLSPTLSRFSTGNMLSIDTRTETAGSAAAGAAGTGLFVSVKVRYTAT